MAAVNVNGKPVPYTINGWGSFVAEFQGQTYKAGGLGELRRKLESAGKKYDKGRGVTPGKGFNSNRKWWQ